MITSIILVTHNQLTMTKRCIESIRKHTPKEDYELVIVDNASTDGTVAWLRQQEDVKLLEQSKNTGFPAGCNIGVANSTGDLILLLNNDTVVTPRWLKQLKLAINSDDSIGAVGPLTNFAGYGQMIETSYRTLDDMQRFAEIYNASSPNRWEERLKLIGFCMLIKRNVWEMVGPLDERYGLGNYEDDDWCVRARLAGHKLLLCMDTFIHHEGHASFKVVKDAYKKVMQKNEQQFISKWGFHPHIATNIREDFLQSLQAIKPGMSVLEIGCGCGATLLKLHNRHNNIRLYGYESDESTARVAALVTEKTWWGNEEINIPTGTKGFDVIILNDILSVPVPIAVLEQIQRLLRPGGIVVTSVPNRMFIEYVKAYIKPINRVPSDALLSKEEVTERLQKTGFDNIEFTSITSEEIQKHEVDALGVLVGQARREELMTMYFIVRAFKAVVGKSNAIKQQPMQREATFAKKDVNPVLRPNPASVAPSKLLETAVTDMAYLPKAQEDVAFTGERLILSSAVSGAHPDVLAEHVYRYRLAQAYCSGKAVLDAACGAGYGVRMMKDGGAKSVTGVDIDAASIHLAKRDYGGEGVDYQISDVLQLPFVKESFDVVVSFETIEHVPDGSAWLREAARVLRPGGRLIVSTPNREVTNPDRLFGQQVRNPYHCFEYSLSEFVGELSALYDIEGLYGQTFVGPNGHVAPEWSNIEAAVGAANTTMAGFNPDIIRYYAPASLASIKNARPAYVIAVCRKK
ncbi:methyltransferase domain-containing protein [Cohnella abietis]|uniref:Glycosyltransferase 2-like domain-containing protein n=1 Tax=Cohnella abietis TaxID=2507935 RepID=A0A3T1D8V5_9BACL|nr:methyltransferase domain-containing protein [Cohnella abietis]BBI34513.1 hypothetical protein KCTCHS21_39120 [Cohnella abietis]